VAVTNRYSLLNSGVSPRLLQAVPPPPKPYGSAGGDHSGVTTGWASSPRELTQPSGSNLENPQSRALQPSPHPLLHDVDPFYLFACHLEWEQHEDPSAAWELLGAAQSSHGDTRAHARGLLSSSRHLGGFGAGSGFVPKKKRSTATEPNMKSPNNPEIIDNCLECTNPTSGFFFGLSESALRSLSEISHKSTLPAGAILFVEGQSPRGTFILCSGKVNLSTTSREGKILILKTAEAGEALGLSATISGVGYESTAETSTPCQLSFLDRNHLLELMLSDSEVGSHAAQCLSRDYQSAYRDIHDLVLTRSSAGKLARLLLSHSPTQVPEEAETRIHSAMTHEEMAQRIGASRETVTRLLSGLKKKRLIRLDGSTLIIRDRTALQAIAV
jgi:CRP/FNR family cyclic AMP-dependent transcriptional regulator